MIKTQKSLSPVRSKIYVTNKQDLQYKISGDYINIKKYVAIVIDCSEGMGYYKLDGARSRFDVLKENAIKLIDTFKNSPETEICIFGFSDMAKEITELLRVDGDNNLANREELTKAINALVSENNSNLGDGMRKAYWKLKTLPSDGIKSMVIMTSGEPDMFTTTSEHLYHDFETLEGNIDFITNKEDSKNVYADYSSAIRYGQEMGKFITAEKIMTFAVGFNKEESYKLESIAASCNACKGANGKHYYRAEGLKDIESICNGIIDEINAPYPLTLSFTQTMPVGIKVLSVPEGFNLVLQEDGSYKISGEIKNMELKKVDEVGNFAVSSWADNVSIQYTGEGRKEFSGPEITYVDRYGNPGKVEMVNSLVIDVLVDTILPVTSCNLKGTTKDGKWYSSDIEVTLTATDGVEGTDVAKVEYKLEGQDWKAYDLPFVVSNEGTTNLFFRSMDNAGNVEEAKVAVLNIDKTAPAVTCTLTGKKGDVENWFVSDVQVELTAVDEPTSSNSGVQKIEYRYENGIWQDYSSKVTETSEGTTKVYFRAIDNVGNTSDEKMVEINIDKTGPVVSIPKDITYLASGDNVCLSTIGDTIAKDDLSGVRGVTNNSSMIFPVGSTAVTWTAVDNNGNESTGVECVTIQNPKLPGEYQYDVIRLNKADYKIWFKANSFPLASLKVRVKVGYGEETVNEMILNNGVWEYKMTGVPSCTFVRYSFIYTKDMTKYRTEENIYRTVEENAIDSDYTKGVLNINSSEAKVWFKTNNFEAANVQICYLIDNFHQGSVYMAKNNDWEFSLSALSNDKQIRYYFLFTKGGIQYKTPEYIYVHYRS
jgi:hypothetical protein